MSWISCISSVGLRAFAGRRCGPHRRSSACGALRQRSMVRAEIPAILHAALKRAPLDRALPMPVGINSRSALRRRRPRRDEPSRSFFSTSSAAASANAFSLRASSRSSWRIRWLVALEARPSSCSANAPALEVRQLDPLTLQIRMQLLALKVRSLSQHASLLLERKGPFGHISRAHHGQATRLLQPTRRVLLSHSRFPGKAA